MPTPRPFAQPLRSPRDSFRRSAGLRFWVGLVLLCIGLQSVLLPAQRTHAQAHFHLGASRANEDAGHHSGAANQSAAIHRDQADDDDDAEEADRDHHHIQIGNHTHAIDRDDVVYVDEGDSDASSAATQGLKRASLDFDGIWPSTTAFVATAPRQAHACAMTPSYRSHVAPPLERPPRPDA